MIVQCLNICPSVEPHITRTGCIWVKIKRLGCWWVEAGWGSVGVEGVRTKARCYCQLSYDEQAPGPQEQSLRGGAALSLPLPTHTNTCSIDCPNPSPCNSISLPVGTQKVWRPLDVFNCTSIGNWLSCSCIESEPLESFSIGLGQEDKVYG